MDKEILYFYFAAFEDSLSEDGREEHPIIKCLACCLPAPAYSKRSKICEMCFDTDFWDETKDLAEEFTKLPAYKPHN